VLRTILGRLPSAAIAILALPLIAREYFRSSTGRAYGLTLADKLVLLAKMVRNNMCVLSASNFISHILMAARLMNVPLATAGVIVECGCYKGGSTVNLSLVAAACGRTLHVFDSFAGLPPPTGEDEGHVVIRDQVVHTYEAGAYAGTRAEVEANLRRYGALGACELHEGFFDDTLPGFAEPVVFAYLDVDLVQSERTCLKHLWPLLIDGGYMYTDEAHHLEIASLFYDRAWWQRELGTNAPGLVGGGNGIGLFLQEGGFGSSLGFTVKSTRADLERRAG
jgi:O-methyltransferase